MAVIECQACGRRLDLPADFPEAGDFACAHCGLWMRNVEAARAFRWASLDPHARRHGASRLNLWGGVAGSVLWLPIVLVLMAARGAMTVPFALEISLPYLALLLWLMRRRARAPAVLWIQWLWPVWAPTPSTRGRCSGSSPSGAASSRRPERRAGRPWARSAGSGSSGRWRWRSACWAPGSTGAASAASRRCAGRRRCRRRGCGPRRDLDVWAFEVAQ